jgi:transglutaminase-like putative cysteine protease
MIYRTRHLTVYRYTHPASLSYNELCLRLRPLAHQNVLDESDQLDPEPDTRRERIDFFGNRWLSAAWERPLTRLSLNFTHRVEVVDPHPRGLPPAPTVAEVRAYWSRAPRDPALAPFFFSSSFVRRNEIFETYGRALFTDQSPFLEAVMALTLKIRDEFEYSPTATTISTPVEEVARTRQGVCQDFAHFQLSVLCSLGFPCRYVSGYLNTVPPAGHAKIRGADASHAWVSVAVPGLGWVDFDPTNGLLVRNGHITLAWGRDYGDVAPLKGVVLGGGGQKLTVEVDVDEETA